MFHFFKPLMSFRPNNSDISNAVTEAYAVRNRDVLKNVQRLYEIPIPILEVTVDQFVKDVIDHRWLFSS